jgi:hypothetical protein
MPVKLNSTSGGSVTLTTPSTASDFTATFPANTGNVVTDSATQTLTNKTLTSPTIGGTPVMSASVITSGTSQASTSGTSIDFTGIPSWVKRITVMFNGVSANGTSNLLVQIGSTSFTTSGYLGSSTDGPALTATLFTSGFGIRTGSAAAVVHGTVVISIVTGNTWVAAGTLARSDGAAFISTAGTITLSGTLDRLRITTVNGTDAFDAGSINILYE